ncbi:MAG: hypothetical protein HYT47_02500 [Candidatus Vogelbacteria bacterium]|nr:hypothetical protein [Candidatus Vogelbacteria bacterium]
MNQTKIIEWVLRIAVAGEFLGHGVFALQGKAQWVKWFADFGISDVNLATQLLFLVGIMDLVVALVVLVKPLKPILLWAAFWGFWTALVRPLVGEPIWDFIERFANWGAPLALYYLLKNKNAVGQTPSR